MHVIISNVLLEKKNAIFIYILLPVILFGAIIMLTGDGGNKIPVYVADEDKSYLSSQYIKYLEEQDQYRIVPITIIDHENQVSKEESVYTVNDLQQLIQDMKINMYITVEKKGFEEDFYKGEDVTVKLYGLQKIRDTSYVWSDK